MNRPVCCFHIGKRPNHEDNFLFNGKYLLEDEQKQMPSLCCSSVRGKLSPKPSIYAVSDGMGGHNAGEVASRICMAHLKEAENEIQHCESVKEAVEIVQQRINMMNAEICELGRKDSACRGMGATLVALITCRNEYAVVNIGDSRAYYFNNNMLMQITKDHTEGQRMLDLGLLTRKELEDFPARKNLSRYMGNDRRGLILQADVFYPELNEGMVILCSDGISDFVTDKQMSAVLCEEKKPERAAARLIEKAADALNADNATVLLIPLRRCSNSAKKFSWSKYFRIPGR